MHNTKVTRTHDNNKVSDRQKQTHSHKHTTERQTAQATKSSNTLSLCSEAKNINLALLALKRHHTVWPLKDVLSLQRSYERANSYLIALPHL